MIKSFSDLEVYRDSKALYSVVVSMSKKFPRDGYYLVDQMRRASNSIHANIAEGYSKSELEFKRYLGLSLGSNNELISHIEDAEISGYISKNEARQIINLCIILGKKIYRLREKWTH